MPDPIEPPAPPSRAALAAVLIQAADSEPLLADRPVADITWGLQTISLANGWRLRIWWHPGQQLQVSRRCRSRSHCSGVIKC